MTYFEMTPYWYRPPPPITYTYTGVDSAGWVAVKATLIQESLDAIRQIVREELHEALLSTGIPSEETLEQEARAEAEDKKFEEVMREAFGNPSLTVEKPEEKD